MSYRILSFIFLPFFGICACHMVRMPEAKFQGNSLDANPSFDQIIPHLQQTVHVLSTEIGERNLGRKYDELLKSADYIESQWQSYGLKTSRQTFEVNGLACSNIEVIIPGGEKSEEVVVIGAHYDSAEGTPGANDNATGVAALLYISQQMASFKPLRTLKFVAFTNEEPPFFETKKMGSWKYAARAKKNNEEIVAMLSIETIGYYSDQPGSQDYPFPLSFFYPDRANFIGFVGNYGSRQLVYDTITSFRQTSLFPSDGAALPNVLPGIGWSDHWSFWQQGYRAIMITDTALFRYPHYHTPDDTFDKIDFNRLAIVTFGIKEVIRRLAMDEPSQPAS